MSKVPSAGPANGSGRPLHKPLKHALSPGAKVPPGLRRRVRPGADAEEVECPGCGKLRPGFCLSDHPRLGFRCDGCISHERRQGKLNDFEEEKPAKSEPGPPSTEPGQHSAS